MVRPEELKWRKKREGEDARLVEASADTQPLVNYTGGFE